MANELLYSVIISVASSLFGVIVGAVITYHGSKKILDQQFTVQKKNIAKAFLSEIKCIEKWLKPSVDDNFLIEGKKEIKFNLYRHALDVLSWDRPFYDDTGLFFISRSQIYCFDEDLYEKIELFYSNLLIADEYRQVFLKDQSLAINEATYHERRRYIETLNAIKETHSTINMIKSNLNKVIKPN
jgi:hypothetical protein